MKSIVCVSLIITGNVPGNDASKNDTREFGGAEKPTLDAEKSFVLD